jgi:hypothetical protein
VVWPYHSHINSVGDANSGLIGAIVTTRKGAAEPDGSPKDVDCQFVTLFKIFDVNPSWYLDDDIAALPGKPAKFDRDNADFIKSKLMHSINEYVYGNMPMSKMKVGAHMRWYLFSLSTETDVHTPHWHGKTLVGGHHDYAVRLLPATTVVADTVPDDPGIWMFHCYVNDHISAGMTGRYKVTKKWPTVVRQAIRRPRRYPLPPLGNAQNLLLVRKRSGRMRPASLRLPRQLDNSFRLSVKLRPAVSTQVRPSLPLKVATSDSPFSR